MQFFAITALFFAAVSVALPTASVTEAEMHSARDLGISIATRSVGSTICNGACDVACNSTVLALAQTECLKVCKSKC